MLALVSAVGEIINTSPEARIRILVKSLDS
jgi:hypothetical protein